MTLHGKNILGATTAAEGAAPLRAVDPSTGERLEPGFHEATEREIDAAVHLAARAFERYRETPPERIAAFLEAIAAELEALGQPLIDRARQETGLPDARLIGERGRTTGQLRMFAQLVTEGSWVDARIDRAQPDRKPLPKADLRRMLIPIGPVAIFGASNFPLAFSVAGGDTASALAAGCSVVVKAHPSHPGTSELAGRAIQAAAEKTGMPDGVFSLIHGSTPASGLALARHPLMRAVAFTGSFKGGRALFDAAAARPTPIPVFAEMGSTNPIFVLPEALAAQGPEIAKGLVQSVTMGVGQFCTNPGLVFGVRDASFVAFAETAAKLIREVPPGPMLNQGISENFWKSVEAVSKIPGVALAGQSSATAIRTKSQGSGAIFLTDAAAWLTSHRLREEVFGPATILVGCASREELERVARSLDGQLTATIHGTAGEVSGYRGLVSTLTEKAGRVLFNQFPTGVEVCPSMQHGGPYPATTDGHSTSVGTAAIFRFARPLCFQNAPQDLLPPELQNANPRKIHRIVDGVLTQISW